MAGFDIEAAKRNLAARRKRRQRVLDERFERAREDAGRIIAMIIERYDPDAVWQWGSLLHRRDFSEISDIDIAVEGLGSPEKLFRLLGEAEALTDFPVDLVELEHIEPEFRGLIVTQGKKIHERRS